MLPILFHPPEKDINLPFTHGEQVTSPHLFARFLSPRKISRRCS
jgi:hypothetical protein